jgi:hypothetical protein
MRLDVNERQEHVGMPNIELSDKDIWWDGGQFSASDADHKPGLLSW